MFGHGSEKIGSDIFAYVGNSWFWPNSVKFSKGCYSPQGKKNFFLKKCQKTAEISRLFSKMWKSGKFVIANELVFSENKKSIV